jgi:hypothetical protein
LLLRVRSEAPLSERLLDELVGEDGYPDRDGELDPRMPRLEIEAHGLIPEIEAVGDKAKPDEQAEFQLWKQAVGRGDDEEN